MDKVTVHVEAEINPTESEEKVKNAVENVFGPMATQTVIACRGRVLTAEAHGKENLTKLYNLLRRERIRTAAKAVFFEGLGKRAVSFCLNKQVAYAGHVSFANEVAESPLGPIKIKITCENPRELIDWLTSESM